MGKLQAAIMLGSQVDGAMGGIIDQVVDIFAAVAKWAGIILAIFGGYKLVMAFINDRDPSAMTEGGKWIVIGALLALAIKPILTAIRGAIGA